MWFRSPYQHMVLKLSHPATFSMKERSEPEISTPQMEESLPSQLFMYVLLFSTAVMNLRFSSSNSSKIGIPFSSSCLRRKGFSLGTFLWLIDISRGD